MKKKKKFISNLNDIPTPVFFAIFLLIITLGLSSPVYSNSNEKALKGKSNSNSSGSSIQSKPQNSSGLAQPGNPSRSSPTPGIGNKNSSRGWGNNHPNRDVSNKLKVSTGKVIRHPRTPPPEPPEPTPAPPPDKPRKPGHPGERRPGNGYWCPPGYIVPTPVDDNEEDLEAPDAGDTLTPGQSNRVPGKEYQVNDSYSLEPLLARKIDEYNAKHLNQDSLEYPRSRWSASLTYQLLESLELIEHMENKIQYYQQQLEAVRNSNLSPAEKSGKELFWLERIDRLEASRQKEEERVFELRSQIEEERRNLD